MKKILILTALFILTIANSFASETPLQKDKSYFFGVNSSRTFGLQAYHINFGKYLSKYDFISLEYGRGTYGHMELANSHREDLDYVSAGFYYRRFIPNPFYILSDSLNIFMGVYRHYWKGDLDYNICSASSNNINYGDCPTSQGAQVKADMKAEVTIASIGLGTHWVFNNGFTVGVDWAILSQKLYENRDDWTHEDAPGSEIRNQINEDVDRIGDDAIEISTSPMTIVITLGWLF